LLLHFFPLFPRLSPAPRISSHTYPTIDLFFPPSSSIPLRNRESSFLSSAFFEAPARRFSPSFPFFFFSPRLLLFPPSKAFGNTCSFDSVCPSRGGFLADEFLWQDFPPSPNFSVPPDRVTFFRMGISHIEDPSILKRMSMSPRSPPPPLRYHIWATLPRELPP